MTFKTIYISNIPIDCHILRGRLESEGIDSFIDDENMVWVHPFRAVAVGGVKLKVPSGQADHAMSILDAISENKLNDKDGDYDISEALDKSIDRQNEILELKSRIREDETLLSRVGEIQSKILSQTEIENLALEEREFSAITKRTFSFSWKDFLSELFDFDGQVFKYLRPKSVNYYLEKELVDHHNDNPTDRLAIKCPKCKSDNISFGYAVDYRWDVLYLILSMLLSTPLPPYRKNYHCFDCKNNFKRRKPDIIYKKPLE